MRINNKLTAVFACCAILASLMLSVTEGTARTNRVHHRPHYREHMQRFASVTAPGHINGCPVHRNGFGELVDCRGWRKWSGSIGWDNTCFRSLENLPAMYACPTSNW
jgi:hypothetical protein